jgi:hypothetical protein
MKKKCEVHRSFILVRTGGSGGRSRLVARMAVIFPPSRGSAWQVCVYVEAGRWPFEVAM